MKSYLRFRDEGPSGDGEAAVDGAEILSHDGETAPLSAARAGRQPLGRGRQPTPFRIAIDKDVVGGVKYSEILVHREKEQNRTLDMEARPPTSATSFWKVSVSRVRP